MLVVLLLVVCCSLVCCQGTDLNNIIKRMIMIPPTIPQIHPQELIVSSNIPKPIIANAARTTSAPANLTRPPHVLKSNGSCSGDSCSSDSFSGGSLIDVPHEVQNLASNEFRPLHFGHSIGGFYHDDQLAQLSHIDCGLVVAWRCWSWGAVVVVLPGDLC